jgi:hypothetical protein
MGGLLRFCKRRDASDTQQFAQIYPATCESAAFGNQPGVLLVPHITGGLPTSSL